MGRPVSAYDFSRTPDINTVITQIDKQYGQKLKGFIAQKLGPDAVEDIYQVTLIRAAVHYHKFDPDRASLQLWLYSITRNLIKNEFRNRARRATISLHEPMGSSSDTTLEDMLESPPDNSVDVEDALAFFKERTAALTPEQRDILYLELLQGRTKAQIRQELGVKEGTVKSRRYRAMESAFPEEPKGKRRRTL